MRLRDDAMAKLKQAEEKMRAEYLSRAEDSAAAFKEEFAQMQVADSDAFGLYAARCDALDGLLSGEEVSRERAAILDDARSGAREAAAQRVERLEQQAEMEHAIAVSQQLVTDEILGRAGATFVGTAREGGKMKGKLEFGGEREMPLTIVSSPPTTAGGPTEHEVVFDNDGSTGISCEEGEEAVREIARKAGAEMELDDPGAAGAQPRRRKKKRQQTAQAKKTRRAG
ncbi:MAG TPA: hypothetical protein VGO66_12850 [Solirubrobacterales bacterium]|nr:hypothetical protein [Solirubrobacterales bacterium]